MMMLLVSLIVLPLLLQLHRLTLPDITHHCIVRESSQLETVPYALSRILLLSSCVHLCLRSVSLRRSGLSLQSVRLQISGCRRIE